MARRNRTRLIAALLTAAAASLCAGAAAAAVHALPNGLTVRVHTIDDASPWLHREDGAKYLDAPGLGRVELLRGVDDPRLPRRDVESFACLDADVVVRALSAVDLPRLDLVVDVYLLSAPPAKVLGSYATGSHILLAPGLGPVAPQTAAALAVHELGHVLTWAYFDDAPDAWDDYHALRGLDPQRNGADAPHAERAREILAEDIRFLFGGPEAVADGGIENASLALPDQVAGLEAYLRGRLGGAVVAGAQLVAKAWPNPCNPRAHVELRLPEGGTALDPAAATLRILDLRGRAVRTLRGGRIENNRLSFLWQGDDDGGRPVPSGRYFYRIGWPGRLARGSVLVVR